MARNRRLILWLQWSIVCCYAVLVVMPAFLPMPHPEARLFSSDIGAASFVDPALCADPAAGDPLPIDKTPYIARWHERLTLLAQYLFWGLWWPFVILSIMVSGRSWCGLFCPEGTLAEFASRHGASLPIPKWIRWGGWPLVGFIATTVYGQMISVYEYPQAALLILGGSTVAAVAVGLVFGRGKRVWCRYLCPVSGVFALLARVSPLHFQVDRDRWLRNTDRPAAVDCPPLLSVAQLSSMAQCHACGRCSGHREAVTLKSRSPNRELMDGAPLGRTEGLLLCFGLLGVALGAFHWTASPLFVILKQWLADSLVSHDIFWPLADSAPWWLLTHQPESGDVFSWLDGILLLTYLSGSGLLCGGFFWGMTRGVAALAGLAPGVLLKALIPIAGFGLFLGLSMMTATHLRSEGMLPAWWPFLRLIFIGLGAAWTYWVGVALMGQQGGALFPPRQRLAALFWVGPPALWAVFWLHTLRLS